MASLPNSPATKAKGKTPLRGGIVAKNKTLLAAGPEEGEAKSSRAAKESARLIEPPSYGASVARTGAQRGARTMLMKDVRLSPMFLTRLSRTAKLSSLRR